MTVLKKPASRALLVGLALASRLAAQTVGESDAPLSRGVVAFRLSDRELIPESVAFDPVDGSYYVGSLYKRKIVKIGAEGRESDFVAQAQDGLWAVLGMKLDADRRELWANACNLADRQPPMIPDDETTRGQGGVFRYDLKTGRLLARYLAGSKAAPRCFNDLVLTPDGVAYLSCGPDGVYRVRRDEPRPELLAEPAGFINGIAASDDGRLLFLADHERGVQVMDLATRAVRPLRVPAGETLAGVDGLYVRGRTLVAIQNGRRNRPERLLQAELSASLDVVTCFTVLERGRPDYDIPTTGVLVGSDIVYVASSQMRRFNEDKTIFPREKLTESVIVRTPLKIPCR
jgi:hypothetical protein